MIWRLCFWINSDNYSYVFKDTCRWEEEHVFLWQLFLMKNVVTSIRLKAFFMLQRFIIMIALESCLVSQNIKNESIHIICKYIKPRLNSKWISFQQNKICKSQYITLDMKFMIFAKLYKNNICHWNLGFRYIKLVSWSSFWLTTSFKILLVYWSRNICSLNIWIFGLRCSNKYYLTIAEIISLR